MVQNHDAVVVPESADDLAGGHLAHVHADEPDDEHAVAAQVVLGELAEYASLALRRVERAQLLAQILHVTRPVQRPEQPADDHPRRHTLPAAVHQYVMQLLPSFLLRPPLYRFDILRRVRTCRTIAICSR